jgi:hypothetical protein
MPSRIWYVPLGIAPVDGAKNTARLYEPITHLQAGISRGSFWFRFSKLIDESISLTDESIASEFVTRIGKI